MAQAHLRRPWMRAAGIHGLVSLSCLGSNRFGSLAAYEQAEQVTNHMTTVPDQNQHLACLSQAVGVNNMQLLANRIGYDGPLELLSMWTCLFGGPTLRLFTRIEARVTSKVMVERASCSQSMRTREQRQVEHDSRTLRAPCRATSMACAIESSLAAEVGLSLAERLGAASSHSLVLGCH